MYFVLFYSNKAIKNSMIFTSWSSYSVIFYEQPGRAANGAGFVDHELMVSFIFKKGIYLHSGLLIFQEPLSEY